MNRAVARRPRHYMAIALASVAVFGLAGCTRTAEANTAGTDGLATGPGVTDTTISLGVLTDLTGPFSGLAKSGLTGLKVAVNAVNGAGGVCGRNIELVVRDHGYNPQQAISAYTEISPNVLGLPELIGTPIVNALADQLASDKFVSSVMAVDSGTAKIPGIMVPITTHDLETINGLSWLLKEGVIKKGDTIGVVAMEGGAGNNTIEGARFMAKRYDFTLVEQRINPATDTDMTAQAIAFSEKGADLIVETATVVQTVSLASVLESRGDKTPIMTTHIGWDPSAVKGDAVKALLERVYVPTPMIAYGSEQEAPTKLRQEVSAANPNEPGSTGVTIGYIMGHNYVELLQQACAKKDLTREGVMAAFEGFTPKSTGLSGPLTYANKGKSPGLSIYMNRPAVDVPGGLKQITQDPFVSPEAQEYYDAKK